MFNYQRYAWAWLVCILLLAGFLTNSISNYLISRKNVRETILHSSLPLTSDNIYSEIQRDLLRPIFISSLMASDTFLRDWTIGGELDEAAITRYLHEIKIKYSTITSFLVSEQSRKYYYAHGLLKTIKEDGDRDAWYFRVKEMEDPYEINVDQDLANRDEMTIFINHRVLDYAGEFIGVTGVGLTVNSVNNLISSYESKYSRQIYFADKDGLIVLRPTNSQMPHTSTLQEIEGLAEFIPTMLKGNQVNISYQRDHESRLLNSRYIPELQWYLIVEESEEIMLAPLREQLRVNLLIALGVTVLVAFICIATVRRHKKRLALQNDELSKTNIHNEEQKTKLKLASDELSSANDRLQALNIEKDEFISIIAHDLRNPLNGVIGLCEIMGWETDEAERKSHIKEIEICGEHMLSLTKTLLDASQIESFQGQVVVQEVLIDNIIEKATTHFIGLAKRKHISLEIDLSATPAFTLMTNPAWLTICIENLVSNAIKYTPPYGKVKIQTLQLANTLEVLIKDSGPGISDTDRKKMFGKFARLSSKPTGGESSSGLGLYVVKKMCDRLGIQIRVESHLGDGACFILSIPPHTPQTSD